MVNDSAANGPCFGIQDGAKLVVDPETTSASVVDKGGILVIRAADQPSTDILREEREQRLDRLWEPDHADLT